MTKSIRIAVVGLGKIARDAHLPAIERNADFELAFLVDRHLGTQESVPTFKTLDAALKSGTPFDAVAVCTSPQPRFELCEKLFDQQGAILLEKPPLASPCSARAIRNRAEQAGIPLFAAWHSRFAPQMPLAMEWAETHTLKRGIIEWRENASKWHTGQGWLWQPGGFGVFDPGINALSILTALYPAAWTVHDPRFRIPTNAHTPISADFELKADMATIEIAFEFHHSDEEVWTLRLEATDGDILELSQGGTVISFNGGPLVSGPEREYDGVYRRFAELVRLGQSDMDISPLDIAADAFLMARRTPVAPVEI